MLNALLLLLQHVPRCEFFSLSLLLLFLQYPDSMKNGCVALAAFIW
jgi:hypothetical protein